MSSARFPHPTLAAALWPADGQQALLRNVVLIVLGSLLMTAAAKVQVPFWPVPMTMQTTVALLLGAAYGWRLGALTVIAYLAQGAIGLPVFANTPERGIGLAYMMGPTGGFLVGFAVAAAITGLLAGGTRSLARIAGAMLSGTLALFVCGVLWLGLLIGFGPAIQAGVLPFLPGEAVKVALAVVVLRASWAWVDRRA